jgi:hypothetical protein
VTATLPRGTADAVLRRISPSPARDVIDPVAWVRGRLSEHLWSKQVEILRALKDHRKVCVQSCHGIGKSYSASRAAAWWVDAHPAGEAMAITSAPSAQQVRSILWSELGKAHRKGGLDGYITRGQVPEWIVDNQQVAFGRKPADYVDQDEARTQFQGIHARYLLVVLDEACGVPQWLWEATETLVTNEASRILAIGNPDDPTSHFAKMCAPGSGWHVIKVSAFDTPNFTGEPVPEQLTDSLVSRLWVDERRQEWGEESPLYISKVLGEFPEVSDDVIITPKLVRQAHERDRSGHAIADQGRFGMDVAEFGADETCIYRNRGGMIRLEDAWRKQDVDVSRARTQVLLERDRWRPIHIDVVSIGAGVVRPLANRGFKVTPFNGGWAAHDPDRFVNRNSEVWWAFREGLEAGLIDLDPADELLASQLQSRRWGLDASQRRIRIETKPEMAARGIKSPDRADAAILSYVEAGFRIPEAGSVMGGDDGSITSDLLALQT